MNREDKLLYQKLTKRKFDENNMEEVLFTLTGVLSIIILTDWAYKKNDDIKHFTQNVLKEDYKFYLFKSRTLLFSRIVKDLYKAHKEGNNQLILTKAFDIKEFVLSKLSIDDNPNSTTEKKKRYKSNSAIKSIESWRNVINPKKEDK
ncbi:hypothetical protein [Bacillus smithii]|uniref:hypothetical protein n=1 Tax=Bacillus smithii TaxID=1479 RepID=UPI003D1EF74E